MLDLPWKPETAGKVEGRAKRWEHHSGKRREREAGSGLCTF